MLFLKVSLDSLQGNQVQRLFQSFFMKKLERTSCEQGIHALHMSSHPSVELHIEAIFSGRGAYLYVAESEVPKGRSNPSAVGFLGSLLLGPS